MTFSPLAWQQIWTLTEACDIEISALGIVAENDTGYVEEFFVPKQTCTAVTTKMDQGAVGDLTLALRDRGISPDRLCVWVHSHVDMATSPSGTDEDNIDRYASDRGLWCIITNKADAARVKVGLSPKEMYLRYDAFDRQNVRNKKSPQRWTTIDCGFAIAVINVMTAPWIAQALGNVIREAPVVYKSPRRTHAAWSTTKDKYGRLIEPPQSALIGVPSANRALAPFYTSLPDEDDYSIGLVNAQQHVGEVETPWRDTTEHVIAQAYMNNELPADIDLLIELIYSLVLPPNLEDKLLDVVAINVARLTGALLTEFIQNQPTYAYDILKQYAEGTCSAETLVSILTSHKKPPARSASQHELKSPASK